MANIVLNIAVMVTIMSLLSIIMIRWVVSWLFASVSPLYWTSEWVQQWKSCKLQVVTNYYVVECV